jgi:hypothetical protein
VGRLPASAHATAGRPPAPTALTLRAAHPAAVEVAFGRERTVFVHAPSGAVLGEGATRVRRFFRGVTDVHRWLAGTGAWRERGRAVTGAANLGFLLLVTSGFFLWWPRAWTAAGGARGGRVPARAARPGARLQLAPRGRHLVARAAARRGGVGRGDLVRAGRAISSTASGRGAAAARARGARRGRSRRLARRPRRARRRSTRSSRGRSRACSTGASSP